MEPRAGRTSTEGFGTVREGLNLEKLQDLYEHLAGHYDLLHTVLTAGSDQRGRRLLVEKAVLIGDKVLDCGAGTGSTGVLAAKKVGPDGEVTLFDLSEAMLKKARQKAREERVYDRITWRVGDMARLPFADDRFDVALSTYSLCPLYDPEQGALELYRVTRPGGRIAVAHSADPHHPLLKWLAGKVENLAWHFPRLSMGCRSVSVLPALERAGGKVIFRRSIGVPLWPFLVFVVEKPAP
jgi:demethylmenaquinone methyltransferase/2-methoxy-6-polyprenyl-1,4-benzoquinol methylase